MTGAVVSSRRVSVSVSGHVQYSTVLLFRAEMESSYLDSVPESLIEIMTCGIFYQFILC